MCVSVCAGVCVYVCGLLLFVLWYALSLSLYVRLALLRILFSGNGMASQGAKKQQQQPAARETGHGIVRSVPRGDSVVVLQLGGTGRQVAAGGAPPERRLVLSHVTTPRLGRAASRNGKIAGTKDEVCTCVSMCVSVCMCMCVWLCVWCLFVMCVLTLYEKELRDRFPLLPSFTVFLS
jgi:hypothetical protein